MPELPEVETTRRGIEPHCLGQVVDKVIVRNSKLRWPVPRSLNSDLSKAKILRIDRRGKYIILQTSQGNILVHLGMSGSLRVVDSHLQPEKHDHLDLVMKNGKCLRLRDPRRFGSVLWAGDDPFQHKLLVDLGPEPLSDEFNGDYLHKQCLNRQQAIKTFIMDSHIVVGVGNIYASESLFRSGIHPKRAAGRIAHHRCDKLAGVIKQVLLEAIDKGGTTLRDFVDSEGSPGYFAQRLSVYDRSGEACHVCANSIRQITLGQRSTYYCLNCQR
ncbi:MAG: bifunctional DNA-formamidopyrimidine glycosylase/DNA-(apurinic or apyrimidinic site) lyase [Gammaproteobacteria bacterium]|nr:bifunctional DNA-formamidopyrimidine glycosylase/DNA-(apurinic or apyrimidinic site) lyase [Gammaproteobacteria bacterium]